MPNDVYYFSHDSNARNDEKILMLRARHGWTGYGLYWALVEMMFETKGTCLSHSKLPGIAVGLSVSPDDLQDIVKTAIEEAELFKSDGEVFWSDSLCRRKEVLKQLRRSRVEAGKLGAEKRWNQDQKTDSTDKKVVNIKKEPDHGTDEKPVTTALNHYKRKFETKYNVAPNVSYGKDSKLLTKLIDQYDLNTVKKIIDLYLADDEPFVRQNGHSIGLMQTRVNKYLTLAASLPMQYGNELAEQQRQERLQRLQEREAADNDQG